MKNTTELKKIILEMYNQLTEEAEVVLPGQEDKVKKLEVNQQGPKKVNADEEESETNGETPKTAATPAKATGTTPPTPTTTPTTATTQPVKPGQPKKPGEESPKDSDAEDENLLETKEEQRIYLEVMKRIRNLK